jgi:hypothetical protein
VKPDIRSGSTTPSPLRRRPLSKKHTVFRVIQT